MNDREGFSLIDPPPSKLGQQSELEKTMLEMNKIKHVLNEIKNEIETSSSDSDMTV